MIRLLRADGMPQTFSTVSVKGCRCNYVGTTTAILKVAFFLWLFDFLIFEELWWNGEGCEGLAQDLPGGKDDIGCQGEEIGEEAGSLLRLPDERPAKAGR